MANRNQGFTLIELIITLSILGIVVAIAIPVVDETIARSRREALKDEVERILHNARAQAIIQRRTVEVCGTGDGKNCSANWAATIGTNRLPTTGMNQAGLACLMS